LQGSVATDLRGGGSFNSCFLRRSFLNLTEKNYENLSVLLVIVKNERSTLFCDTVSQCTVVQQIHNMCLLSEYKSDTTTNVSLVAINNAVYRTSAGEC